MQKLTNFLEALRVIPYVAIAVAIAQVIVWSTDRRSPFEMTSYEATAAAPGGTAFLVAKVERNLDRKCGVEFSRHMFDSRGYRWELSGLQAMSNTALERMNDVQPDKLLIATTVPMGAAPGTAKLVTVMNYECNPVHRLWPIHHILTMNFEVLR